MGVHIFGPVPSRRLGMSLGVDLLPAKTCTFNCIYCQVGRTTVHTARRRAFFGADLIVNEIRAALRKQRKVDYITFSGSGEPTLASNLGDIIRRIKAITDIPVAVLTNSSLISRKTVQRDLLAADLLVPSLDAATQETLRKINRPCRGIKVGEIIRGLAEFGKKFKGQMWLEVMLAQGINDAPSDIDALHKAIAIVRPHRVQLNTVFRPPCEAYAKPLSSRALERIARRIAGDIPVEIIAPFKGKMQASMRTTRDEVLELLKRRSCTVRDISASLGIHPTEALKHAEHLVAAGRAQAHRHRNELYYLAPA